MGRLITSIFYAAVFGGMGWGLLALTTAYEKEKRPEWTNKDPFVRAAAEKTNADILKVIKNATKRVE